MGVVYVGIGVAAIVYSIVMFVQRVARLETIGKKVSFMERVGKKGALFSPHLFAYSIIPFIVGVIMVIVGLRGVGLF